jgi:hypothetical protein
MVLSAAVTQIKLFRAPSNQVLESLVGEVAP